MSDEQTIKQWLYDLTGDQYDNPLIDIMGKVKEQWPYILIKAPVVYSNISWTRNLTWEGDVLLLINKVCDNNHFIVYSHREELVLAFQDISTAVATKLQVSFNEDYYKVTYGGM